MGFFPKEYVLELPSTGEEQWCYKYMVFFSKNGKSSINDTNNNEYTESPTIRIRDTFGNDIWIRSFTDFKWQNLSKKKNIYHINISHDAI